MNVNEGTLDEEFGGRKWELVVKSLNEFREEKTDTKTAEKAEKAKKQDAEDDAALLTALDKLDRPGNGVSRQSVMEESRLTKPRMGRAVTRLVEARIVKELPASEFKGRVGNNAERPCIGLRREKNTPVMEQGNIMSQNMFRPDSALPLDVPGTSEHQVAASPP